MNLAATIRAKPFVIGRGTLGRRAGAVIRDKLVAAIAAQPAEATVKLSFQGVDKIDAAFAAEAVVAVFAQFRGKRALFLADVGDPDTSENIIAAAERAKEPITLHDGAGVQVIGLAPTRGTRDALAYALARSEVRIGEFRRQTGISAQNASNKFKQLWQQGFLLRRQIVAASGAPEFVYRRIG